MVASLRTASSVVISGKTRRMSLERLRQWQSCDGWKYDWNNGKTTKYKNRVSEKQRYIVRNVLRAFHLTDSYKQGHDLFPESEMAYDDNRYRIPDIAYFTREQTKAAANGEHTLSSFIIEILSDTDLQKNIENKLWEYFEEGVQVVWHILPYRQIVKVYTSPRHVSILTDGEICSAQPAIPNFEMTVNEIFELKD